MGNASDKMGRAINSALSTGPHGTPDGSAPSGVAALAALPASTFASTLAPPPRHPLLAATDAPARPEFSVIIVSTRERDERFTQVEGIYQRMLAGEDYEIVRVADAKSIAEGYLRGAGAARGETLIFSHDDAAPVRPFASRLRSHLRAVSIVAGAGTDRLDGPAWLTAGPPHVFGQVLNQVPPLVRVQHPDGRIEERRQRQFLLSVYGVPRRLVTGIQAFDGFWFACNRAVLDRVSFDPVTCDGFHLYDIDFSFRAYQAGVKIGVATDLSLMHASTGGYGDPKWRPKADAWWEVNKHLCSPHRNTDHTGAAVAGDDVNVMLALMDRFVSVTES